MEKIAQVDDLSEISDISETQDEEGKDTTDWKTIAQERHEVAKKNYGIGKRYQTKFNKLSEDPRLKEEKKSETEPEPEEKKGFDYTKLAYLEAKDIPEDDHDYVLGEVKATGKELKEVLAFKYVQEELKTRRENAKAKEATPSSPKRGAPSGKDSVDYWLAKNEQTGELPTDPALRRKVVNAKIDRAKNQNKFTENPVV